MAVVLHQSGVNLAVVTPDILMITWPETFSIQQSQKSAKQPESLIQCSDQLHPHPPRSKHDANPRRWGLTLASRCARKGASSMR